MNAKNCQLDYRWYNFVIWLTSVSPTHISLAFCLFWMIWFAWSTFGELVKNERNKYFLHLQGWQSRMYIETCLTLDFENDPLGSTCLSLCPHSQIERLTGPESWARGYCTFWSVGLLAQPLSWPGAMLMTSSSLIPPFFSAFQINVNHKIILH